MGFALKIASTHFSKHSTMYLIKWRIIVVLLYSENQLSLFQSGICAL